MVTPKPLGWITAAVAAAHVPYLLFVVDHAQSAALGNLRGWAAGVAAVLLLVDRLRHSPRRESPPTLALVALIALGAAAVLGPPWLGALTLPAAAGAWIAARYPAGTARRTALPLLLLAAVYPLEAVTGAGGDFALQELTAHTAAPLVSMTGLSVAVQVVPSPVSEAVPTLVGPNLYVHVTALCAGAHTLLTLLTLGILIAEVFIAEAPRKLAFVALAPLAGFAANVLRVGVSTHAANWWAADAVAWGLAHDVIGYGSFAVAYGSLWWAVRRTRRLTLAPASRPAAASSRGRGAKSRCEG